MRILQINKFFWPSGGPERYMFDLTALLESKGHEVAHFSMHDPRNRPSPYSKHFVSGIDYRGMNAAGGLAKAGRVLGGTVYSFEARAKLRELVQEFRPDIAHLHLIDHHLSPSILHALREAGVPAVQTVHDYKLVCPNYQLYLPEKAEICERCLPGKYYHCVGQRCMKDSLSASLLVSGAMYLHKALGLYEKNVAGFLCASEFLRAKLERGGVPPDRLRLLPLYINPSRFTARRAPGDYVVYAGRLVMEKGLGTLLRAMKELPELRLKLLGEGPARPELEEQARALSLANVEFAGFLDGEAYAQALAGARALLLPSEMYETFGLVVWDANALGVPAIGARIGGIPEAIREGETGLLFAPGDARELADKIRWIAHHPAEASAMGERARARVEAECGAHYDRLMAEYARAMGGTAG